MARTVQTGEEVYAEQVVRRSNSFRNPTPHNTPDQGLNFPLLLSFFIRDATISVTFNVNNPVQHYECHPERTV